MNSVLLALLLAAPLQPKSTFDVDRSASTVKYSIVHKLHQVDAISREVEARALVRDDGSIVTMVRVPVASFRSGDANRDAHMLEAVEAGRFPFVVFKGVGKAGAAGELPAKMTVSGEVDFHGVRTPLELPVEVSVRPDGRLQVRGAFDVSLDAHKVERPSLLFVPIDDRCRIGFDVVMARAG